MPSASRPSVGEWSDRLPSGMAPEHTRKGKLSQLVADHIFGHINLLEIFPVVDQKRHGNEFGDDGAVAGPGLDGLALTLPLGDNLLEKLGIHVRAFFQ